MKSTLLTLFLLKKFFSCRKEIELSENRGASKKLKKKKNNDNNNFFLYHQTTSITAILLTGFQLPNHIMTMDPFEARVHFGKQLTSLSASKRASQELAHFVIYYADIREDLFPAVLETLHRVDLNCRISIFQFVDELISMIATDPDRFPPASPVYSYISLSVKQLPRILTQVLPKKPTDCTPKELDELRCLTNLRSAFMILKHISEILKYPNLKERIDKFESTLLTQNDVKNIRDNLPFNESSFYEVVEQATKDNALVPQVVPLLHPERIFTKPIDVAWEFLISKKRQSQYERVMIDTHTGKLNSSPSINKPDEVKPKHRSVLFLSQKQMLQRMEADRERQKKGKETLWSVDRPENKIGIPEFKHIWQSFDKYDPKTDRALLDELNGLFNICRSDKLRARQKIAKARTRRPVQASRNSTRPSSQRFVKTRGQNTRFHQPQRGRVRRERLPEFK